MKPSEAKRKLAERVQCLKGEHMAAGELLEKAAVTLLRVSGAKSDSEADDLALDAAACLIAYVEWS